MSNVKQQTGQETGVNRVVKRKTPEMAGMVEQGYGISIEDARKILVDWEKNPHTWPYEQVQKARAAIAAYETDPIVVDPTPGWVRSKRQFK